MFTICLCTLLKNKFASYNTQTFNHNGLPPLKNPESAPVMLIYSSIKIRQNGTILNQNHKPDKISQDEVSHLSASVILSQHNHWISVYTFDQSGSIVNIDISSAQLSWLLLWGEACLANLCICRRTVADDIERKHLQGQGPVCILNGFFS